MKKMQAEVKKFNEERNWQNTKYLKDWLLNINKEVSEFWDIIKWVDAKEQDRLVKKHIDEARDFVGDALFLIFKIASLYNIDAETSLKEVIKEYEKRFPIVQTKNRHTNIRAGGIDLKYKK